MILASLIIGVAVAGSPFRPLRAEEPAVKRDPAAVAAKAICLKERQVVGKAVTGAAGDSGIANLPFAMGRRFRTLDEYLAHLKCRAAPIDLPWWREIRPGVYEQVKTKTGAAPEIATRAELIRRFGFSS